MNATVAQLCETAADHDYSNGSLKCHDCGEHLTCTTCGDQGADLAFAVVDGESEVLCGQCAFELDGRGAEIQWV